MGARTAICFLLSLLAAPAAFAVRGPALVAVHSTSPWTFRELEGLAVPLVSWDATLGVAYLVATPEEHARLHAAGFALATVDPEVDAPASGARVEPDLGLYHTVEETAAELAALASLYPERCTLRVIGSSVEGRDILALKISDEPASEDASEPDVLIIGCHHAREFMTVEVPLFLARTLLEGYGVSPQLTRLVDTRELWVVPLLNPDGHRYQEVIAASPDWAPPGWRKNRRANLDGSVGVDLNRNYGYAWGIDDAGSSGDGPSEDYRGTGPFSEPETQAIRRLVEAQRFTISVSYHSFGNLILYPWGHTRYEVTDDHAVFEALADSMAAVNRYRTGNAYTGTIYLTNGSSDDYLYGEFSTHKPLRTLAFTVELNSAAEGGFWPPESRIAPTCSLLLPLNLFVLEVAAGPRRPLPPPAPQLVARQDPGDPQHIRLDWSQPPDADNPVHHYEVFELLFAPGEATAAAGTLRGSGRLVLGTGLAWPASGSVELELDAELEPLWDYAYIEARHAGGSWRTLAGAITGSASPTGRNSGDGITGSFIGRRARFGLESPPGAPFDLALRVDAHADTPARVEVKAALDLARTYSEERRIIAPDVRGQSYDVRTTSTGLAAYGVTAVDDDGQRQDSNLFFAVLPSTSVEASDFVLETAGEELVLSWQTSPATPLECSVWVRTLDAGETPGSPAGEWARGDYQLVASCEVAAPGSVRLAWPRPASPVAVLLRVADEQGTRVYGPWSSAARNGLRLGSPVPNPSHNRSRLLLESGSRLAGQVEVCSVDGRRVRLLWAGEILPGSRTVEWDGRTDAGLRAPAGVYLVRLRAGEEERMRRLVLLRR